MKNYFENIIDNNLAIDLITGIVIEFLNDNNEKPSEREFEEFVLKEKMKINIILERLSKTEKIIFLDKLKKDLSCEYEGARMFFLKQIKTDLSLDQFPEFKGKKSFELTHEQLLFIESKYSLNQYFESTLKILLEFINEITPLMQDSPHQQTQTEQETPTFKNNFDNITPVEIYNHFKAGLVEKGYLTEQELNEYLKSAFELKTKPETLFKLKHTLTKQKIYTVFYIYYKDIAQKKHEKQKEYAALLGDYFEGYKTEIIQTNWARDYVTKR